MSESLRPIPQAFYTLVKQSEELHLEVYSDPVGIPTIYWGHVCHPGEVYLHIESDARKYLGIDANTAFRFIDRVVIPVLNDNQYSAVGSLVFNIGTEAFKTSHLLGFLNIGNFDAAADQFLMWNKAHKNGQLVTLPGLETRRLLERRLFLTPVGA